MAKERDVLTPSQKIDVGILIRANMRRVGTAIDPQTERGYWVYINDYTDERIANEVGCNVAGVHHIRLSDRGKFPPASLKEAEQRTEDLATLQKAVVKVSDNLVTHTRAFNDLLTALVNRNVIRVEDANKLRVSIEFAPTTLFPEV